MDAKEFIESDSIAFQDVTIRKGDTIKIHIEVLYKIMEEYHKSKINNCGGIVIPNKLTDKNRILSRAMTYISEDADEGCSIVKQIFIELGSLIEE